MSNQIENVTFAGLARVTGKVSSFVKLENAVKNGADVGALLAAKKHAKAIVANAKIEGVARVVHALASGNIRPAAAVLVEVSGRAVSLMEIDGKAPYSEFLRLIATLESLPQTGKTGKPTPAAKALTLAREYQAAATRIRAAREAAKADAMALTQANMASDTAPV